MIVKREARGIRGRSMNVEAPLTHISFRLTEKA